jgi:hypothetical protein
LGADPDWLCRILLERQAEILHVQTQLLLPGVRGRVLTDHSRQIPIRSPVTDFDYRVLAPLPERPHYEGAAVNHGVRRMLPLAAFVSFSIPLQDEKTGTVKFYSLRDPSVVGDRTLDTLPLRNGRLLDVEFPIPSSAGNAVREKSEVLEKAIEALPRHQGFKAEVLWDEMVMCPETVEVFNQRTAPLWRPLDAYPAIAANLQKTNLFDLYTRGPGAGQFIDAFVNFAATLSPTSGQLLVWHSEDYDRSLAVEVFVIEKHNSRNNITTSIGIVTREP